MNIDAKTPEEAATALARFRGWSPYRFRGVWFAVQTPEGFKLYRTKKAAATLSAKLGQTSFHRNS